MMIKLYFSAILLAKLMTTTPLPEERWPCEVPCLEQKLFEKSFPQYEGRTVEALLPNELKLRGIFLDNSSTDYSPDSLMLSIYQKTGESWEEIEYFVDLNLDGLKKPQKHKLLNDKHYLKNKSGNILGDASEYKFSIKKFKRGLEQLLGYARNPEGEIPPIQMFDEGILSPTEVPTVGLVLWKEPLPGFEVTSLDVIFHGQVEDRIQLVRIDPTRYKLAVHNAPGKDRRTIEEWQQELNALAVVNGSYYKTQPYGKPAVPMMIDGERKGPTNYVSGHGAFLAEPLKKNLKPAVMVDYLEKKKVEIDAYGYAEGMVSYPTLLDQNGRVRAELNPQWRANRTFIALDKEGRVILGNTQGGFFSLHRLGNFLKAADSELHLEYALNLDGGPPACMAIDANEYKYVQYGIWETNDRQGMEIPYWNQRNASKWKIPVVISVRKR